MQTHFGAAPIRIRQARKADRARWVRQSVIPDPDGDELIALGAGGGVCADDARGCLARNFQASAALIVNEAVITAFDRIAAEPSFGQRKPPMCAMIGQRHGLACFGAVEDDILTENCAAKRNASDLIAPGPHIPLI